MSHRSGTAKSLLSTSNLFWSLFIVAAVVLENSDAAPNIEEILQRYDVDADDAPDCQVQDIEKIICPKDEKVCCGDMSEIKAHCANLLGPDVVSKSKLSSATASDAFAGCISYVSYHIVDHDHLACCPSKVCDDWLENVFSNLDGDFDAFDMYQDDDDDFDDAFDDDAFDDDAFDDDEYYVDHSEF